VGKAAHVAARVAAFNDHVDCLSALWPRVHASSRNDVMQSAARAGSVNAVEFLLSAKADLGYGAYTVQLSPTGLATTYGHVDVLQVLLRAKAPRDWRRESCLHIAIQNRDDKALDVLLHMGGGYADVPDPDCITPLVLAVKRDEPRMVSALLSAKADAYGFTCRSALASAAVHSASSIDVLVQAKTCVDCGPGYGRDLGYGRTPLKVAAYNGRADSVLALLKAKAQVNGPVLTKRTPLHVAMRTVHTDQAFAVALLEAKADVHRRDKYGNMPLHEAVATRNRAGLQLLLQFKADPNHAIWRGSATPLHLAVEAARTSAGAAALANLMYCHTLGPQRVTARSMVALLSEMNPKMKDLDATDRQVHALTEALLSAKADVDLRDTDGRTPLDLAQYFANRGLLGPTRTRGVGR
jgi:ankyrin repeat protein